MRWFGFGTTLGIDLGTANVRVCQHGRGVVLREPAVVAVSRGDGKLVAMGEDAWQMLGRTPGNIQAVTPLRAGVIANYSVAAAMLRHIIDQVCGRGRLIHPDVAICLPCGATDVEKRAVLDAAHDAGARRVYPMLAPVAAAIGAGLPVTAPQGSLVVDIGAGTTDIAVMSLGGVVAGGAARVGGQNFDDGIVRHLRWEHNLIIGEQTAEEVKHQVGAVGWMPTPLTMEVRGRDVMDGLPRTVRLESGELDAVVSEPLSAICDRVCQVLEGTPPELAADIMERGMVLTGGGALLRGMAAFISKRTNVPARVADDPMSCVAEGAGRYLDAMRTQDGPWQAPTPAVPGSDR